VFTIGFDLDLTLIDTRQAIAATYRALAAETGVPIDLDQVVLRIGPPLEVELGHWFAADRIPAMADRYRELYPAIAIPKTTLMPGAAETIAAVRDRGGRPIIVTGKAEHNAIQTVRHLGLDVQDVIGSVFGAAKGAALIRYGAGVYVGDHVGDVDAARAAGALSVGVTTGACDAETLRAYGADLVVPDLPTFIEYLTEVIDKGRWQVPDPGAKH
jgi:phosphoglycolate phosphatase